MVEVLARGSLVTHLVLLKIELSSCSAAKRSYSSFKGELLLFLTWSS
jgi:hypothetical protein